MEPQDSIQRLRDIVINLPEETLKKEHFMVNLKKAVKWLCFLATALVLLYVLTKT